MTHVTIGPDSEVADTATIGKEYCADPGPTRIGPGASIRGGAVVYADVTVGEEFATGHNAVVREHSRLGDDVLVGTNAVIDGQVSVGSHVSIQTGAYVPPETTLGDEVFLGPHAVITNDAHPIRAEESLEGASIADHVSVGANAVVLPGVTIGRGSFVAAGAVVAEDVPPERLAVGTPAEHRPLPTQLRGGNRIA